MAKDFFAKNSIAYEEKNVLSDLDARKEMFDKSHQMGVPVIVIDEKVIVGFDKSTIEDALELK
jgi:glutaredoxin